MGRGGGAPPSTCHVLSIFEAADIAVRRSFLDGLGYPAIQMSGRIMKPVPGDVGNAGNAGPVVRSDLLPSLHRSRLSTAPDKTHSQVSGNPWQSFQMLYSHPPPSVAASNALHRREHSAIPPISCTWLCSAGDAAELQFLLTTLPNGCIGVKLLDGDPLLAGSMCCVLKQGGPSVQAKSCGGCSREDFLCLICSLKGKQDCPLTL